MLKKRNLIILILFSLPLLAYSQSKNTYHISGFIDNSYAPDKARLNDGDTVTPRFMATVIRKSQYTIILFPYPIPSLILD